LNNFVYGFFYPFKCIKLFFIYPKLIAYSIVPMVINLIIYGTIFYFTFQWITGKANDSIDISNTNFLIEIIKTFLKVFTFLLVILVCYFLFIIFGGIVAAPFNERISRLVEIKFFHHRTSNELPFLKDAVISIKEELKKVLFYLSVLIPLFFINFIPMIGSTISIVVGTPFSFFYNALDYLDYPMTRSMRTFRQKLQVVDSQRSLSLGFGCMAFLLTVIPVVNVLMNPLLVAAGTSLYHEKKYGK